VAPRGFTPDGRTLATPGRRFLGFLVDLAIWFLPQMLLMGGIFAALIASLDTSSTADSSSASGETSGGALLAILLLCLLLFALAVLRLAVEAEMIARRGQTWGMRALHLRVVDARTGGPLTRGRAWGRAAFGSFISGQLFAFGYWWSFFDDRRRTVHDLVCATVVINER